MILIKLLHVGVTRFGLVVQGVALILFNSCQGQSDNKPIHKPISHIKEIGRAHV